MHDLSEAEIARYAEEHHDDYTENDCSFRLLALGRRSIGKIIASARVSVFAIALARCNVGGYRSPGAKPEDGAEDVDGCKGVNVAEAVGARPHWDHRLVDKEGHRDPALQSLLV